MSTDIIVTDINETMSELLLDFAYDTFKYEYERNNTRQITFIAYKTRYNEDVYNLLQNEAYIEYKGQKYVIKTASPSFDGFIHTKEIIATHIMFEFQNHYVSKDTDSETINDDSDSNKAQKVTLNEFLEYGFKGNKLGYSYEIKGSFNNKVSFEGLGEKNGMEYLVEGAELFGFIYYADNKKIYIHDNNSFYVPTEKTIRYKYNNSEVKASIDTKELKTVIKGYGKKLTSKDTKNYSPVKPKDLTYSGKFIKDGTWRTEEVGASFSYELECKYGNETIVFSLKKMSKGGMLDLYFNGEKVGEYSCYSKSATTQNITLSKNTKKGKYTVKAVFKGKKSGVDYKKSAPCMYVGTEKATVINTTAVLKGDDLYSSTYVYKSSKSYDVFGHREAPDHFDESITDKDELKSKLEKELKDEPDIELDINYIGDEKIEERDAIWFIHEIMGYNTELKVVSLIQVHPLNPAPDEIGFSNNKRDIVQISNVLNRKMKSVSAALNKSKLNNIYSPSTGYTGAQSLGVF
ncbi:prophage endopeptidase tail family protein [Staphylococcus carnosus]|uniref:prophage endopeptidase tail family protein n=1 Tax=Staphylococcus carnosus TaxID=1281 RepID=UPI0020A2C574|nr:prophage endopeptidase tail family protein [Staphylococcus carnosus]